MTPEMLARILRAALEDEGIESVDLTDLGAVFVYEGSDHPETAKLRRALERAIAELDRRHHPNDLIHPKMSA